MDDRLLNIVYRCSDDIVKHKDSPFYITIVVYDLVMSLYQMAVHQEIDRRYGHYEQTLRETGVKKDSFKYMKFVKLREKQRCEFLRKIPQDNFNEWFGYIYTRLPDKKDCSHLGMDVTLQKIVDELYNQIVEFMHTYHTIEFEKKE